MNPHSNHQQVTSRSSRYYVKVVGKTLKLIATLKQEEVGLRLTEIAENTHLDKPTALRILYTLQRHGWVTRDPSSKRFRLAGYRSYRIGYAQLCAGQFFSEAVTQSLIAEAKKSGVELLIADNQLDAQKAVQNAEWLIQERVDFAIEFQIHYRTAMHLASMFAAAQIPTLAIDIPQPGAVYFGADNYLAGIKAGEALGRYVQQKWNGQVDSVLLLETFVAGPPPHARLSGTVKGLRNIISSARGIKSARRDARDTEVGGYTAAKKFIHRLRSRERLAIACINDAVALGALRAVREEGHEYYTAIVGQNFSPDTRVLTEIQDRKSPFIGSVAFFPERYGPKIISTALAWLNGKQVPPAIYTDHAMITKENVNELLGALSYSRL